jgi:hypothetical protein
MKILLDFFFVRASIISNTELYWSSLSDLYGEYLNSSVFSISSKDLLTILFSISLPQISLNRFFIGLVGNNYD